MVNNSNFAFLEYLLVLLLFISCSSIRPNVPIHSDTSPSQENRYYILDSIILVTEELIFDKDVILYPGAFIITGGNGLVVFRKPVSVIGDANVFDVEANIKFEFGSTSRLNPVWFGAKGYDDIDDTYAFEKVFELASTIPFPIRIEVPIGRFLLSRQILAHSVLAEKMILHFEGTSLSPNGTSGSSIVWNGPPSESSFVFKNQSCSIVSNIDFGCVPGSVLKHNILMRPYVNQINFVNCSFGGCTGMGSSNINLNEGNNQQVSEITFQNCLFRGVKGANGYTSHAISGGWGNTKNFHLINCSIGPYLNEAIHLTTTDVLLVQGCTFFENDVDISCETCKSMITANYSEGSFAFFQGTVSSNFNSTTLINNQFNGVPKDGFVVRDGSGSLVMMNNNFGGGNYGSELNRVRWEENQFSTIYSVGNVFKNGSNTNPVFLNKNNSTFSHSSLHSVGDLGGVLGENRVSLENIYRN